MNINRQNLIEELNSYHYTAIGMRCGKKVTAEIIKGYHDHVIEVINSQPPADQWIPCSERLPDKESSTEVLVTYYDGVNEETRVEEECYFYGVWVKPLEWNENRVAWMPLPEPYKGLENK